MLWQIVWLWMCWTVWSSDLWICLFRLYLNHLLSDMSWIKTEFKLNSEMFQDLHLLMDLVCAGVLSAAVGSSLRRKMNDFYCMCRCVSRDACLHTHITAIHTSYSTQTCHYIPLMNCQSSFVRFRWPWLWIIEFLPRHINNPHPHVCYAIGWWHLYAAEEGLGVSGPKGEICTEFIPWSLFVIWPSALIQVFCFCCASSDLNRL